MSNTKKSFLIATIAVVMVLAVAGISFAAWSAYNNANDSWTINAKTPGELTITNIVRPTDMYNGEVAFTSTATATLTSTTTIADLAARLTMTCSVVNAGVVNTVAILDAETDEVVTSLTANVAKNVKIVVTFGDYSNVMNYGATFAIAVEIGVIK